jgi:hypothetical protein
VMVDDGVDIAPRAGEIIVGANHARALRQEPLAQMRPEEAGSSGHQYAGFKVHLARIRDEITARSRGARLVPSAGI